MYAYGPIIPDAPQAYNMFFRKYKLFVMHRHTLLLTQRQMWRPMRLSKDSGWSLEGSFVLIHWVYPSRMVVYDWLKYCISLCPWSRTGYRTNGFNHSSMSSKHLLWSKFLPVFHVHDELSAASKDIKSLIGNSSCCNYFSPNYKSWILLHRRMMK